jgi:heme/copper-type cytochrome/quinol oxidase subunit 2
MRDPELDLNRWRTVVLSALAVAVLVALILLPATATACPTCKESIADGGNSANLVQGFGWSIIFMMSMPFLILGGLAAYFYFEIRKARKANSTSHDPASASVLT